MLMNAKIPGDRPAEPAHPPRVMVKDCCLVHGFIQPNPNHSNVFFCD